MAVEKIILTKLRLDSKSFSSNVSKSKQDLVKLSAAAAGVTAALGATAIATATYQDGIIKAARATGTTAEEFSTLNHAAELSGVSMDTLRGGLIKLTRPSDQAQKTLKSLGVTLRDNEGRLKSQTEVLGQIADKFQQIESPQKRTALAFTLFEEAGTRMVNVLKDGSAGLEAMRKETEELGLVVSEQAGVNAEVFNDSLANLKNALEGVRNSIGQTIIAAVNQSGVIQRITDVIKGAIRAWNNLSDSTKETILTIAGVIAGFVTLTGVLAGIMAIAPLVGSAIAVMTGPIGIVITALGLLATGAIMHWEQMKDAVQPLIDTLTSFGQQIKQAVDEVVAFISDLINSILNEFPQIRQIFDSLSSSSAQASGEISIFGSVVKAVFKVLSAAVQIFILQFQIIFDVIKNSIRAIIAFGKAAAEAFKLNFAEAGRLAKEGFNNIKNIGTDVANRITTLAKNLKKTFDAPTVVRVDTKQITRARKEASKLGTKVKEVGKAAKETDPLLLALAELQKLLKNNKASALDLSKAFAKVFKESASKAQVLIGAFKQVSDVIVEDIKRRQAIVDRDFQVAIELFRRHAEREIEMTTQAEDAKIEAIKSSFDAQIKAIEDAEKEKFAVMESASNERLLLLNEEFQEAKRLAEEKFQQDLERERLKFEMDKELLLERAIDKEQRQLTESILDEDFRQLQENLEAAHVEELRALEKQFAENQKAEKSKLKEDIQNLESDARDKIEQLNQEKDAALLAAEESKNKKLEQLEEAKNKRQKELEKERVRKTFEAEKAALEATKAVKVAEIIASTIAAAAQAFAALAPIPFVGPALGAVAAAIIIAAGTASAAQVASQQVVEPAELSLQTGGVIGGNITHAQGGIPAELESGEGVIDKSRTEKLIEAVDSTIQRPEGLMLTFNFERGSIVTSDSILDEDTIEEFTLLVARRMEREGFAT